MDDVASTTEIEKRVRSYIVEDILSLDEEAELPSDVPLLSGLLDSFGLLSLLTFLEETYEITIQHDEIVDENFQSVEAVVQFVELKRGG